MDSSRFTEDNYLPCQSYANHSPDRDGFARFDDPDTNQWYFVLYEGNKVLLRSEGYTNEPARDKGIESVKNNMDDDDRYQTVKLPDGRWILSLQAANHKEIARSCPYDSKEAALAHLPSALKIAKADMPRHKEDDYLLCKEYEGHNRSGAHQDFALFEKQHKYYFALLNNDNEVLLRSEGYSSPEARNKGIESVIANRTIRDHYKTEKHSGYYFVILHAANHHEIARSCPKSESAALALIGLLEAPFVTPPVVEPVRDIPEVPVKSGTSRWKWLLPLLLLLLLFWWWRSCESGVTGPVYASEDDCGWQPILFDFDSDVITSGARAEMQKVVDVMEANPSYRALFIGFTDSKGTVEYNQELSLRRANAARQEIVNMGIDGSRISTDEQDEHNPVASKLSEAGRMFNRRVVMYVFDDRNRLVCKQIALDIPDAPGN